MSCRGFFHYRTVTILIVHQEKPKLVFNVSGLAPMHLACQRGQHEVVTKIATLVPEWIDTAADSKDKYTPLHIACEHFQKEVISILLQHGAKVSTTKKDELSPLHIAVRNEFTEGVKLLLEKRPECANLIDKQHRTSLHLAGEHCHIAEIITLLLR